MKRRVLQLADMKRRVLHVTDTTRRGLAVGAAFDGEPRASDRGRVPRGPENVQPSSGGV